MAERALTLTQPWATLVVAGLKRVETRSWKTPHRGRLCIHAAKGFPAWAKNLCNEEPFRSALTSVGIHQVADLPRAALLGEVRLLDCVPTTDVVLFDRLTAQELAFGDYTPGRWAWLLDGLGAYDPPRPCRGALGLWRVPETAKGGGGRG